jgi:hypothetical protein
LCFSIDGQDNSLEFMSIKLKLNTNFDGPRTGAKMMDENLNPHIFVAIQVNNDKKTLPYP